MAEGTSVGVVQLDVEINPKSLNSEMNKLGKAFNSSFKNMFAGAVGQTNNFVKDSIGKMVSSFKNLARTGTGSSEKVSQSISRMNSQYEKTQTKIRDIKAELNGVYSQLDLISSKYADFPAIRGLTKSESMDQLLGADKEYQKLAAEAAKLEASLDPLTAQSRELSQAIGESGAAAQKASANLGSMRKSARNVMGSIFRLTWVKKIFNNEAKKASSTTSGLNTALSRMSRTIVRNLVVYGLIIKGLRGMISYMWSALKTNKEFSRSLDIIRTNLLVAFQPIYDFILPALNALMRAVATVTTYIASAISALFGRTYQQSFRAAKGLKGAVDQMKGLGGAAKKAGKEAKGALAPFDEINQLNLDKGAEPGGGGGSSGFEMTMPDMSAIDTGLIDSFKNKLATLFEPFRASWANEGKKTVDSIRYAFSGIWSLLSEIGKSFETVWTGGSGQRILESIYRSLQNIFNLIGDIGYSFASAWREGGKGTGIIQKLTNTTEIFWETIELVTGAFRDLWAAIGDDVARAVIGILYELATAIEWVAEKVRDLIKWVLDGGLKEFQPLLQTIKDSFMDFWNSLSSVWESIKSLIKSLEPVFIAAGAVIAGVVGIMIGLFNGIVAALGPMIDGVINFVDTVINVFYSIISLLRGDFSGAWKYWQKAVDSAIKSVKKLWEGVISFFKRFVESIVNFFKGLYNTLVGNSIIPDMVNAIVKWFKDMVNWVLKPVEDLVKLATGKFDDLKNAIGKIWDDIRSWTTERWNGIRQSVTNTVNSIKNNVTSIVSSISRVMSDTWNSISSAASRTWNNIKNAITSPIDAAKNSVKRAVDAIAGFFQRLKIPEIKIPKIKLPRFSISGKFSLSPLQVPKFNVNWYDKGGIFTGPQIIGVGEKRPEFVGALDDLREIVRDEIKNAVASGGFDSGGSDDAGDIIIKVGEDEFARIAIRAINKRQRGAGGSLLLV